jgi:hypothetical protein
MSAPDPFVEILCDPSGGSLGRKHLEQHQTLDQQTIDWLADEGVSAHAMSMPWSVMMARVRFGRDGRFNVDADGVSVLSFAIIDHGEIVDIACWHVESGRLATWFGRGCCLGEGQVHQSASYMFGASLPVYRRPLSWLRNNRRGIVIVDARFAYATLAHVPRLQAEDAAHRQEVNQLLQPPQPRVRITVPQVQREATHECV